MSKSERARRLVSMCNTTTNTVECKYTIFYSETRY